MSQPPHVVHLPLAEEVEHAPYELLSLKAPVMRGLALDIFLSIYESSLGYYLYPILGRQSGVNQVLHQVKVPEHPLFQPDLSPMCLERLQNGVDLMDLRSGPVENVRAALDAGLMPHLSQVNSTSLDGPWVFPHLSSPTVADYARAYRQGLTTPSEVAERIIEFLTCCQACSWFVAWSADEIRKQAAESTQRFREGHARSVLEGVPWAVKDVADALPYLTTAGTSFMAAERPVLADAPYVSTLRMLGGMLLGKTAMHEIGLGVTGLNLRTGTPLNPHDLGHFCGGSSGGTAAVLAAGICPIAVGSDGGGSIRIPASFCGVVGLKPSAGRIAGEGVVEIDCTVATMGPMAGCVQDCALLYAVMAQHGCMEEDGTALLPPPALPRAWPGAGDAALSDQPLKGVTIGLYPQYFSDAGVEVVAACRTALNMAVAAGARLLHVEVPELELLRVAHTVTIASEMMHCFRERYSDPWARKEFNKDVRLALSNVRFWTPADYLQAQRIRMRMNTHFRRALADVDCLAMPSTPITAPAIHPASMRGGESNLSQTSTIMRFAPAANLLGLPALSLPVGHDLAGLPIGLQLLGRPLEDGPLLRIGAFLEAVLAKAKPGLNYRPAAAHLNPITNERIVPQAQ